MKDAVFYIVGFLFIIFLAAVSAYCLNPGALV